MYVCNKECTDNEFAFNLLKNIVIKNFVKNISCDISCEFNIKLKCLTCLSCDLSFTSAVASLLFIQMNLTLVALVAVTTVISANSHSYQIVTVDERFRFSDNYQWRSFDQPNSDGKMYPYNTIRVDQTWSLSNYSEVNGHLNEVCGTQSDRCPIFHSTTFLSSIRNMKLGILGDSLGFQLFNGLHNCLTPYISSYLNGSGYELKSSDMEALRTVQGVRIAEYNVTIYFCWDVYLLLMSYIPSDAECMPTFLNATDIFVFGVAAWYKPKHRQEHRNPGVSYNDSYKYNVVALERQLRETRLKVKTWFPQAKVIWRNQPHVGRIDEWIMLHNIAQDDVVSHANGLLWSNVSLCAHWVPVYNDIIARQAELFGDPVLDWYSLSLLYIDYFNGLTPRLAAHVDSLHYFADGLPRGGALLLQDAVNNIFYQ